MRIKMRITAIATFGMLAALLAGCSESDSPAKAESGSSQSGNAVRAEKKAKPSNFPVDNLDSTSVVIRVNSQPITQRQYEDWLHLRVRMFCEANRLTERSRDDRLDRVRADSRVRAWNELIRRELLRQEAVRLGVKGDPKNIETLQKRFMRQIKHGKEDFGAIGRIFGEKDAELIRAYIASAALEDACLEAATTNDISNVTDEELDAKIEFIKDWNIRADASNAVQIARAKAAKAEILGGRYFYDVTTNCADFAQEDGKEWQVVELSDFEADEPLAKWLMTARPGDISDPMDLEDGISIVGLRMIYTGDDEGDETEEDEGPQYDIVRCAFRIFEKIEEPDDREQFRKDLLAEKRNVAMRSLGQRLVDASVVEFPYGEKVFAEQKNKNPKRGKKPKKPANRKKAAVEDKEGEVGK